MAGLYSNIDAAQLQADAESSLLNHGTKYHLEIITHAKEHYIYTASGHRMPDGQMSCLIGHGHSKIVETITQHAAGLDHLFSETLSPPMIQSGKRLTNPLPKA